MLIHGSGRATRMLWLADLFASEGIAVLTYDKRGVGRSGGQFVDDFQPPAQLTSNSWLKTHSPEPR